MSLFTKEYLEYVLSEYGNIEIKSTNCSCNPTRVGDYVYNWGFVKDLLRQFNSEVE